jgi:hypothetical protein
LKKIKLVLKIAIPLLGVCIITFIVLHLSPELSIRGEMLRLSPKSVTLIFSNSLRFLKSPKNVINLSPDKYVGKGTLYQVGQSTYMGYSYYLVRKDGFLYFAKMIGNA